MSKVQLILVDGVRPDALALCKNPYISQLLSASRYTLHGRTVFPSVTLPCHMSLFHSVDPDRHGVTTNTYTPQVRPINGLIEQIAPVCTSAMFGNWETLRDLCRPGGLDYSAWFAISRLGFEESDQLVCEETLKCIREHDVDFIFTYLGCTDETAHAKGWMGEEYLNAIDHAFERIRRIIEQQSEECITIVLADHGGHGRSHGTEMDEDMTIPVILHGRGIEPGVMEQPVSIKDVAPTIVKLLGCRCAPEWEGSSLL